MDNLGPPGTSEHELPEKGLKASNDETQKESSEINGSSKAENDTRRIDHDQKKSDHHHHHKKNRGKNYETSSDDKKTRDKKKRKKSREHEKKKNKKDRKDRSDRDKEKKPSSKAGSVEKTPEAFVEETNTVETKELDSSLETEVLHRQTSKEDIEVFERESVGIEEEPAKVLLLKKQSENQSFKRSDSVLDINIHADMDLDEWIAPEVSKWEREENKSTTSLDISEMEIGNCDAKKNLEEKVTSEILKRAENAIFARAISAIRPMENKKVKALLEHEVVTGGTETSPVSSSVKKSESGKDLKTQAFQVTIPTNETGNRSVELKSSDGPRESSSRLKKSPMKTSIKNRLGIKIVDKKSRSKTPSPSSKRRLQSDCTKVVRSSRDSGVRSQNDRQDRQRPSSSENRRSKQLSSFIKVTHDVRDSNRHSTSRGRPNDKRRSPLVDDRKGTMRRGRATSRSRSASRHNVRRHDQRSNPGRNFEKPKEPAKSDDKSLKVTDAPASVIDNDKAKAKNPRQELEVFVKKRSREPSSSSTSSSASSSSSQKHSKRHSKHKIKKKSRSLSVESNGNAKRKKSKKEKKSKKKKKSRK